MKGSFSCSPFVKQEYAFCGVVLASWGNFMHTLVFVCFFFSLMFTGFFASDDRAQNSGSICNTDWCPMKYCSGFGEGSFLDNVAFLGFHIISEVFPMFYDVVEDVVPLLQLSTTCLSSAYHRCIVRSCSTLSISGRTSIPYIAVARGSLCCVFLWQQFVLMDEESRWFWVGFVYCVIQCGTPHFALLYRQFVVQLVESTFGVQSERSASASLTPNFSRSEWMANSIPLSTRFAYWITVPDPVI